MIFCVKRLRDFCVERLSDFLYGEVALFFSLTHSLTHPFCGEVARSFCAVTTVTTVITVIRLHDFLFGEVAGWIFVTHSLTHSGSTINFCEDYMIFFVERLPDFFVWIGCVFFCGEVA